MKEGYKHTVGYVLAVPQSEACEELKIYDPEMQSNDDTFYVDTIMTMLRERQFFGIMLLLDKMAEEAAKRGINKFSMHARKSNGLSRLILRKFPLTKRIRTIDNWHGWGEPFDYIEGIYDKFLKK